MDQTTRRATRPRASTIVIALLAGLVVLLALFPAGGLQSDPPVCYSMLFYTVPCDARIAWVAAVVTAGLVGLGLWTTDRRRH